MAKKIALTTTPTPKAVPAAAADQWVENRSSAADEGVKRLTLDLPESLHRRIKAQCALDGRKMVDVIREMLEEKFPQK